MGGFTVNGCGTGDSFYTLRVLKGYTCRSCGKQDYALMEVKRKIKVFYIPTVSINTKYAIACPRCKNGYYISAEQKAIILEQGSSCLEVRSDGVYFHAPKKEEIPVQTYSEPKPEAAAEEPENEFEIVEEAPNSGNFCQCGEELAPNALFCSKCGAKVGEMTAYRPEAVKPEPSMIHYQRGKVCPECGMRSVVNRETCAICGAKL